MQSDRSCSGKRERSVARARLLFPGAPICRAARRHVFWPRPLVAFDKNRREIFRTPRGFRKISRRFLSNATNGRSEEHTSELQSRSDLVCRLLLEKKKITNVRIVLYMYYR